MNAPDPCTPLNDDSPPEPPPDESPAVKRTRGVNNRAKGKRLVSLAKEIFESQGALVEVAPLQVRWVHDKDTGKSKAIMLAGDYFGCWDLMVVLPDGGPRFFVQVTTWGKATDRRKKIRDKGFPSSSLDVIMGYVDGQRHFRCLRGPLYLTEDSEVMTCV